ncbi:hypothetical protein [Leptospira jelokensis]|nr:hypothetical protein [Leptospira jelokensis]
MEAALGEVQWQRDWKKVVLGFPPLSELSSNQIENPIPSTI